MESSNHQLLLLLSVLMMGSFIPDTCADTSISAGQYGAGDQVFVNCTVDVKGTVGRVLKLQAPFITTTKGAIITYINVENKKPYGQMASISVTGGGVGKSSVTFYLVSVESHGFLFNFYIYGRTPLGGPNENPLVGSCFRS